MTASPNFPQLPPDWNETSDFVLKNRIHARLWCAPKKRTGRFLFIVHGQAEQSGRYEHFPFYLSGVVDAIGILDLPGHGRSKGRRGHIENFDQYSEAALEAFRWSLQQAERKIGQPLEPHWLGHSLGGLITLRTLLKKQDLSLCSVCTSAPLLGLAMPVPFLKRIMAILTEPLLGKLSLSNELDLAGLSRDPSVRIACAQDPLNHDKVTPRFFVKMIREMELLKATTAEFAYHLMILSPLSDPIVSWKAVHRFFQRLKMKTGFKKELQTFPNFLHESFNEVEKGRAFLALENWLLKNTKTKS